MSVAYSVMSACLLCPVFDVLTCLTFFVFDCHPQGCSGAGIHWNGIPIPFFAVGMRSQTFLFQKIDEYEKMQKNASENGLFEDGFQRMTFFSIIGSILLAKRAPFTNICTMPGLPRGAELTLHSQTKPFSLALHPWSLMMIN